MNSAPKDIAVFIDGTWNRQDSGARTNVRKLYEASKAGPVAGRKQAKLYVSGVGTKPSVDGEGLVDREYRAQLALYLDRELPPGTAAARSVLGGAFGKGTTARIKAMYRAICADFDRRRGDRVYLFGFSRGAFAARSLAGFLATVGLLLRERLDHVDEAWALYESAEDPAQSALADWLYKLTGRRLPGPDDETWLPLHFLGVWDTVGALGLPSRLAWLSAPFTEYHQVAVPPNVMYARQALALHELRAAFEPLPWRDEGHSSLEQLWFPGAHADVGGGYPASETGLSDAALAWMATEAESKGLVLDRHNKWLMAEAQPPRIHHEIRGLFLATMPTVRRCLDPQRVDEADRIGFHEIARTHLFASPRPAYAFEHPFVNAALRRADEMAASLIVRSGLRRSGALSRMLEAAQPAGDGEWPVADWWDGVTLDELADSASLAARLVDPGVVTDDVDTMRTARALAIRQLCVDGQALARAVDDALAATTHFCKDLRPGTDTTADTAAANAWLGRCRSIDDVFRHCGELIGGIRSAGIETRRATFGAQVNRLRDLLIERAMSSGTRRDLVVQVTCFRKKRP